MPPKRKTKPKNKTGTIKNKKNAITSRLLEISLQVDDYIYKDKPISAKKAALLLEEVSGYRGNCLGDRRCLQVIEKLERFMKMIIEEQKELQGCKSNVTKKSHKNTEDVPNKLDVSIQRKIYTTIGSQVVENDISWIENLHYVREIREEEIIPIHYECSFWEGNTLPNDWNDELMFQ